jgi:hypothetical protein
MTAASSQNTWLSPESLTALTAADSGFAAFGCAGVVDFADGFARCSLLVFAGRERSR